MIEQNISNYPWLKELEKTVVHSLTTSFGLDFLFFKDKVGGNVDTVYNVRQGIYATVKESERYQNRDKFKRKNYDAQPNYIEKKRKNKEAYKNNELHDAYRDRMMSSGEVHHVDHVISLNEIHKDRGVVLAELNGVELADARSNLQTTLGTVNLSKKQTSIDDYLVKLPNLIETHQKTLANKKNQLARMSRVTPQQQHEARKLESEITKTQKKIDQLKSIDPKKMLEKDKEARKEYNGTINKKYYGSSKFLQGSALDAGISGVKMGARQMLGLVLAECWFELRSKLSEIIVNLNNDFAIETFLQEMKEILANIWIRVKSRFTEFLNAFKDGVFAGVMSSVMTTIFNIFATTCKQVVKIIREIWGYLIKAIKLIFFNPENLSFIELCQAVIGITSAGVATVVGTIVYTEVTALLTFPFGSELAAFVGALTTGIITLAANYFLIHSKLAQKVWRYIESCDPNYRTLKDVRAINSKLDAYLTKLALVEFNLDADEMEDFSRVLELSSNEIERSIVIKQEIEKRNIDLPYELGNTDSVISFLASKVQ